MKKLIILNCLLCAIAASATAQIQKEVEVVKPYQPVATDAFKLQNTPQFKPQSSSSQVYDYSIKMQNEMKSFSLGDTIPPARTVSSTGPQGLGIVHLGFGNYLTPYGEAFLNYMPERNTALGLHLHHISSGGKITLQNNDKVSAGSSLNEAELTAAHYFDRATVDAKIFFDRTAFRYYGYRATPQGTFLGQRQAFPRVGLDVGLNGANKTDMFRYRAGMGYRHFSAKTGQKENMVRMNLGLAKQYDSFSGLLDIRVEHAATDSMVGGERRLSLLQATPAFLMESDKYRMRLGIKVATLFDSDDTSDDIRAVLFPDINLSLTIAKSVTLFADLDGSLQPGYYSDVIAENPYIRPNMAIKPSNTLNIDGGLRARVGQNFSFMAKAAIIYTDDCHFFALPDNENTFTVVYEHRTRLRVDGEATYKVTDIASILLKLAANEAQGTEPLWNIPDYEALLAARVTPNRFVITGEFGLTGERQALLFTSAGIRQAFRMGAVPELNVGVEYRFNDRLSFWGHANNMLSSKYDSWLGYTGKQFNVLFGASYSF
ncbi:MAG: hypothetical protein LBR06_07430 [Bacteroidales bacterium]|jgi:hypothetical protein|nr:hypothetical protein [Bacteroidales bacterium]